MSILRWRYQLLWFFRKVRRKVFGTPICLKRYGGKTVISNEKAGNLLAKWIETGQPFMAGRFGGTELNAMVNQELDNFGEEGKSEAVHLLVNYSGFFPDKQELLEKFCNVMYNSCKNLDLLAVWDNYMEDYMVSQYVARSCVFPHLRSLEPWYTNTPWTASLKGKKVLVIHPFEKTIRSQYARREKLFPGTDILPEFKELYILKAVQTIAGRTDERFSDWFEALNWMYDEAMKYDFDLAILGCGAYGFPLAAKIKEAGRQAVHMGGALQLWFGIKGKRWDTHPEISKLYNEYWVRPDESEKPERAEVVEEGCYW
ncbi:MAG: hypothetical protein HFJ10_02670 [Lachnospiraceae bacterium]|jgi:hypothetical protein|nr:hypothetical protein [Lachnospiraceae bacterium]